MCHGQPWPGCPGCEGIILRIVETPQAIYRDARDAVSLCLERCAP